MACRVMSNHDLEAAFSPNLLKMGSINPLYINKQRPQNFHLKGHLGIMGFIYYMNSGSWKTLLREVVLVEK